MGDSKFDLWKKKVAADLEKVLSSKDVAPDEKRAQYQAASLALVSADKAFRCLEVSREMGASLLPNGTASNVIEIAQFLYQVERDIIEDSRADEDDDGDNLDPSTEAIVRLALEAEKSEDTRTTVIELIKLARAWKAEHPDGLPDADHEPGDER